MFISVSEDTERERHREYMCLRESEYEGQRESERPSEKIRARRKETKYLIKYGKLEMQGYWIVKYLRRSQGLVNVLDVFQFYFGTVQ